MTATVTGTPSNVQYTYTFDSIWKFDVIQRAKMTINGVAFDIKGRATITGNTITFNLGSFSFNNGDNVTIQLDSRYLNVAAGTYSLTAAFNPGTSDTKAIVVAASGSHWRNNNFG